MKHIRQVGKGHTEGGPSHPLGCSERLERYEELAAIASQLTTGAKADVLSHMVYAFADMPEASEKLKARMLVSLRDQERNNPPKRTEDLKAIRSRAYHPKYNPNGDPAWDWITGTYVGRE